MAKRTKKPKKWTFDTWFRAQFLRTKEDRGRLSDVEDCDLWEMVELGKLAQREVHLRNIRDNQYYAARLAWNVLANTPAVKPNKKGGK